MSVIILLILFSMAVAGFFLFGFIWSVSSGQYDDEVSPAVRILSDPSPSNQNDSSNPNRNDHREI
jgi:cbb3-type cytochrome oxidase maturation protein